MISVLKEISPELREEICDRLKRGEPHAKIIRECRVGRYIVEETRRQSGLPARNRKIPLDVKSQIEPLLLEGKTYHEIARTLKISWSSVRNHAEQIGMNLQTERRRYIPEELKIEALKQIQEGKSVKDVAESVGVCPGTLRNLYPAEIRENRRKRMQRPDPYAHTIAVKVSTEELDKIDTTCGKRGGLPRGRLIREILRKYLNEDKAGIAVSPSKDEIKFLRMMAQDTGLSITQCIEKIITLYVKNKR